MSDLSYIGPPTSPVAAPFDLGYRPIAPLQLKSQAAAPPATGSPRDQVVSFWQSSGAPPHVAQGIADAVHGESGFNASDSSGDGGTSWGMYQHHADRLDRLKAFAAQQGRPWSDPAVQNQFALSEVRGGDAIAAAHWKEILNAPDRETAKALWSRYFERPAGGQGAGGGVNQDELAARKAAGAEMMGAVEQFKKATADATAGSPEWNAAYHAAIDKFNNAREKLDTAIADKPSPPQSEMLGHFGSMATVIGMIAGMFARRPLMGMLNGAAGAMSAQNQGDWDRYHASMDQWKANSEMLLHVSEMQQRYLQNIMEDRSKEMSEKLALANSFLEANKMTYQMKLAEAGMPDQLLKSSLDIQAGVLQLQKLKGEIENGGIGGAEGADFKLRLKEYADKHPDAPTPPADVRRTMLEDSMKATRQAQTQTYGEAKEFEIRDKDDKVVSRFLGQESRTQPGVFVRSDTGQMVHLDDGQSIHATTPGAGRQQASQLTALRGAGNEAVASLSNLVELPLSANAGALMGVQYRTPDEMAEALKRSLARTFTPQDTQDLIVSFSGVSRSLATLEAQGRAQGLVGLSESMGQLMPQSGDTPTTILRKYAEVRQIVDRAMENAKASGQTTPEADKLFDQISKEAATAVPWTVHDVNMLEYGGQNGIKQFADKMFKLKEVPASYPSADAVKSAYQAGKITRDQALKILRDQFGHQ